MLNLRMPNLNKVIITGNLVDDPNVSILESGVHLAKFTLANNRRFRTKDGEWHEKTCFVDVVGWRKTAELIGQFCHKGSPVLVEGELVQNRWEDSDGNKRSKLEITVMRIQFLEQRDQSTDGYQKTDGTSSTSDGQVRTPPSSMPDDDIPF